MEKMSSETSYEHVSPESKPDRSAEAARVAKEFKRMRGDIFSALGD